SHDRHEVHGRSALFGCPRDLHGSAAQTAVAAVVERLLQTADACDASLPFQEPRGLNDLFSRVGHDIASLSKKEYGSDGAASRSLLTQLRYPTLWWRNMCGFRVRNCAVACQAT